MFKSFVLIFMGVLLIGSCDGYDTPDNERTLTCLKYDKYDSMYVLEELLDGRVGCYNTTSDRYSIQNRFDYITVEDRQIPIMITGNLMSSRGQVLYVPGGPRGVIAQPPELVQEIARDGYTVFTILYYGKIKTNYPLADVQFAIADIVALEKSLKRLIGVVSESAGSYLTFAAGIDQYYDHVAIAPLMEQPANLDQRLGWRQRFDRGMMSAIRVQCISSSFKLKECASSYELNVAFWGELYYRSPPVIPEQIYGRTRTVLVGELDRRTLSTVIQTALSTHDYELFILPEDNHFTIHDNPRLLSETLSVLNSATSF